MRLRARALRFDGLGSALPWKEVGSCPSWSDVPWIPDREFLAQILSPTRARACESLSSFQLRHNNEALGRWALPLIESGLRQSMLGAGTVLEDVERFSATSQRLATAAAVHDASERLIAPDGTCSAASSDLEDGCGINSLPMEPFIAFADGDADVPSDPACALLPSHWWKAQPETGELTYATWMPPTEQEEAERIRARASSDGFLGLVEEQRQRREAFLWMLESATRQQRAREALVATKVVLLTMPGHAEPPPDENRDDGLLELPTVSSAPASWQQAQDCLAPSVWGPTLSTITTVAVSQPLASTDADAVTVLETICSSLARASSSRSGAPGSGKDDNGRQINLPASALQELQEAVETIDERIASASAPIVLTDATCRASVNPLNDLASSPHGAAIIADCGQAIDIAAFEDLELPMSTEVASAIDVAISPAAVLWDIEGRQQASSAAFATPTIKLSALGKQKGALEHLLPAWAPLAPSVPTAAPTLDAGGAAVAEYVAAELVALPAIGQHADSGSRALYPASLTDNTLVMRDDLRLQQQTIPLAGPLLPQPFESLLPSLSQPAAPTLNGPQLVAAMASAHDSASASLEALALLSLPPPVGFEEPQTAGSGPGTARKGAFALATAVSSAGYRLLSLPQACASLPSMLPLAQVRAAKFKLNDDARLAKTTAVIIGSQPQLRQHCEALKANLAALEALGGCLSRGDQARKDRLRHQLAGLDQRWAALARQQLDSAIARRRAYADDHPMILSGFVDPRATFQPLDDEAIDIVMEELQNEAARWPTTLESVSEVVTEGIASSVMEYAKPAFERHYFMPRSSTAPSAEAAEAPVGSSNAEPKFCTPAVVDAKPAPLAEAPLPLAPAASPSPLFQSGTLPSNVAAETPAPASVVVGQPQQSASWRRLVAKMVADALSCLTDGPGDAAALQAVFVGVSSLRGLVAKCALLADPASAKTPTAVEDQVGQPATCEDLLALLATKTKQTKAKDLVSVFLKRVQKEETRLAALPAAPDSTSLAPLLALRASVSSGVMLHTAVCLAAKKDDAAKVDYLHRITSNGGYVKQLAAAESTVLGAGAPPSTSTSEPKGITFLKELKAAIERGNSSAPDFGTVEKKSAAAEGSAKEADVAVVTSSPAALGGTSGEPHQRLLSGAKRAAGQFITPAPATVLECDPMIDLSVDLSPPKSKRQKLESPLPLPRVPAAGPSLTFSPRSGQSGLRTATQAIAGTAGTSPEKQSSGSTEDKAPPAAVESGQKRRRLLDAAELKEENHKSEAEQTSEPGDAAHGRGQGNELLPTPFPKATPPARDILLCRKEAEDWLMRGTLPPSASASSTLAPSEQFVRPSACTPPPISIVIGGRLLQDVGVVEALREVGKVYCVLERMELGVAKLPSNASSNAAGSNDAPSFRRVPCIDAWLDDGTALSILDYSDWEERRKAQLSSANGGSGATSLPPPLPLAGPSTAAECQDYVRALSILLPSMQRLRIAVILPPAPSASDKANARKSGSQVKDVPPIACCPPSLATLLGTILRPTMVLPLPLPEKPRTDDSAKTAPAASKQAYGDIKVTYVVPSTTPVAGSPGSWESRPSTGLLAQSSYGYGNGGRLGTAAGSVPAARDGKSVALAAAVRRICVDVALRFSEDKSSAATLPPTTTAASTTKHSLSALVSWLRRGWLVPPSCPLLPYCPELLTPVPSSSLSKLQVGYLLKHDTEEGKGRADDEPSPQEQWLSMEQAAGTSGSLKPVFPFLNEYSRLRVLHAFGGCLSALAVAPLSLLEALLAPHLPHLALVQLHSAFQANHGLGGAAAVDEAHDSSSPPAGAQLEKAVVRERERLRRELGMVAAADADADAGTAALSTVGQAVLEVELTRVALKNLLAAPATRIPASKPAPQLPVVLPPQQPQQPTETPSDASLFKVPMVAPVGHNNTAKAPFARPAGPSAVQKALGPVVPEATVKRAKSRFDWAAAARPDTAAPPSTAGEGGNEGNDGDSAYNYDATAGRSDDQGSGYELSRASSDVSKASSHGRAVSNNNVQPSSSSFQTLFGTGKSNATPSFLAPTAAPAGLVHPSAFGDLAGKGTRGGGMQAPTAAASLFGGDGTGANGKTTSFAPQANQPLVTGAATFNPSGYSLQPHGGEAFHPHAHAHPQHQHAYPGVLASMPAAPTGQFAQQQPFQAVPPYSGLVAPFASYQGGSGAGMPYPHHAQPSSGYSVAGPGLGTAGGHPHWTAAAGSYQALQQQQSSHQPAHHQPQPQLPHLHQQQAMHGGGVHSRSNSATPVAMAPQPHALYRPQQPPQHHQAATPSGSGMSAADFARSFFASRR